MSKFLFFEKINSGYLSQYKYSLEKNESGEYISNDTQVFYYGWRQSLPHIEALIKAIDVIEEMQELWEQSLSGEYEADCFTDQPCREWLFNNQNLITELKGQINE